MVRGINRTVIEINDTGSNFFEKVIFFVTPEYGNIGTRKLKAEADRIIGEYYPDLKNAANIRDIYRKRRLTRLICIGAGVIILLGIAVLVVFK